MGRHFALIGHNITHSISPFIHKRLFDLSKNSAEYNLIDITTPNLSYSMSLLNDLDGYNITIPHKQNIIPYLDKLCNKAELYHCVNTVKNTDISCGYNTDSDGFLNALSFEKIDLNGNIAILGCGGAARTFAFESVLKDCNVTFVVRDQSLDHAHALANDITTHTNKQVNITTLDTPPQNIDLLINATPIGMYPNSEQMPISKSILKNCKSVFDAVYNPSDTLLIKTARANGSIAAGGLSMLVYQAVFAHKIWDNSMYSDNDIFQLIYDSKNELKSQFLY